MKSNNKFKSFLFYKGLSRFDLLVVLLIAVFVFVCRYLPLDYHEVVKGYTEINLGYSAKQAPDGKYYVLDNEHERILCFDANGHMRFAIENPSDEKSQRLYIDDFAVADDGIYLAASEWDGMALAREAILKYSPSGNYIECVTDRDYSENRTNKHRFYGLNADGGKLLYIECLEDSIINGDLEIPYENAFNAVSDATFYGETLYVLDKKGIVTAFSGDDLTGKIVYTSDNDASERPIPYRLSVSSAGELYFTDIRGRSIRKIDMETAGSTVVFEDTDALTIHESVDGQLMLLDDGGLLVTDGTSELRYLSLKKGIRQRIMDILGVLSCAVVAFLTVILLIRLIYNLLTRKYNTAQVMSFWFTVVIVIVSAILCSMLLRAFRDSYYEKIEEQVECAAYMVANQLDGADVARVEETGGFGGEVYNRLCQIMDNSFPMDIGIYNKLYCNILCLDEEENGYAVAYLDQSIGSYFPLDSVETDELKLVRENKTAVWNQNVEDISGSYLSVKVPIFDSKGDVTAAVAVGVETYVINDILFALQFKVFMSVVIILLIIWIVMSEAMTFVANMNVYRQNIKAGEKDPVPSHLIRLLVFFVFAVYNMTATFLPVYLMRHTDIFPENMKDFLGALPVTVNIFIIGVMSLFCAGMIRKFGIRKILVLAVVSSMTGNLLMFIIPTYATLMLGLILDGIGVGIITNSLYIIITYIKDEVSRTQGLTAYNGAFLSGINFGMMLGSLLAVMMGQRLVFLVVGITWLSLLGVSLYMIKELSGLIEVNDEDISDTNEEISTGKFVLSKPVFSFIALIQNPYIIFGSFAFYFVPLYCDEHGYSETICSILIMLYSEVAVICGDILTERFSKLFGNKAMYWALFTNVLAMGVYTLMPNMLGIIIALLFMGMGASYGKPIQQTYFLGLKKVKQYGEDRAMGIYNFSENIGESLGPVIMGKIMATGPAGYVMAGFLGLVSGAGALHYGLAKKGD